METIVRAVQNYANHAPLDELPSHRIQEDLLAIAGKRHTHKASVSGDACALCLRDLRDEIHLRVGERE